MRVRRRNLAWLLVIGALVGVAVLSGIAAPQVSVALVALFLAAAAASLLDVQPSKLASSVQRSSLARMRMSPQAQEAVARAARRGSYPSPDLTLLDVGLIASQTHSEGMVMRRTRAVSKDDDGVRPYITLHVQPAMADVTALIRFEILDPNGQQQYVHEMKTYLRDGEMNILADHQLPLDGNDRLSITGDADLRIYVDGVLIGALSFAIAPSVRERDRQISRVRAAERALRDEDESDEDVPATFEELLRSQRSRSR